MKRLIPLYVAAFLALPVWAGTDESPAIVDLLAGTVELGRVNGTALACGYTDLVAKAKAMMLLRVPKTRRFGEAYETASSDAFRTQTSGSAACPELPVIGLRLEMTDLNLQDAAKRAGVQ